MTSPEMKKAPVGAGAINNRTTNYQKEETMSSSLSHPSNNFDTRFELPSLTAGSVTIRGGRMTGGDQPDQPVIVLDVPERDAALTPAQALSIAAGLQAQAVHLLEQSEGAAA